MEPNYVLQRTPGTSYVSTYLRGPAPLNTALGCMNSTVAKSWALALLAVAGAFFIAGLLGGLAAVVAGLWETPAAGFAAAFAVVAVTYWAAPSHKLASSAVALLLGAAVAWPLLKDTYYPERYPQELAYQRSYLPLASTYFGGLLAFACVGLLPRARRAHAP